MWPSGEEDIAEVPEFQMFGANGEKAVFEPIELRGPDLFRGRGDRGTSTAAGVGAVLTVAVTWAATGKGDVPRDRDESKEGKGRREAG